MKIMITGSTGMVGRSLCRILNDEAKHELLTPSHKELDLLNKQDVGDYISTNKPDMIVHLAARVGGIQANIDAPVEFLFENMQMGMHVIHSALRAGVSKLINLGSSCMYPRNREILRENDLITGEFEPTNEGYALAKVSAARLCQYASEQYGVSYRAIIPTNLYGPYDNFDLVTSHVLPAIVRKVHEAKVNKANEVVIWSDGKARREFLYVDDLADLIKVAISKVDDMPYLVNAGVGYDVTINECYAVAAKVIGYEGKFTHDTSKPAGMYRKLLDISKARALGWQAKFSLEEGIKKTYQYYSSIA